ncbi:putative alpha/beta hydrolase [Mycolicibacterium thermoresistibile]
MALQLKYLRIEDLISGAGGDPWGLNRTIQSGSPGEISELADAFHKASGCLLETKDEFDAAKQRFAAAWDRQDSGEHPINDSEEVRRATKSLQLNQEQLSRVAVDLQNIAASLAEAQRSAATSIRNLEMQLQLIDNQIDREIATAAANGEDVDVSRLRDAAVDRTRESLDVVRAVRDAYSEQLESSRLEMAAEGYTAEAAEPADGTQQETNQDAHAEADSYGAGQRAADEALVNSPGPWTPEKQAAAARLRDYATINDPTAGVDEVRYAGERLNDFRMSQFTGPLPVDTVLGGDARSRAQARLQMQKVLETPDSFPDGRAMTPDQATQLLNEWESRGRDIVLQEVTERLQQAGLSPQGAAQIADEIRNGAPPSQFFGETAEALATHSSALGEGTKAHSRALPSGQHWGDAPTWSQADIHAMKTLGTRIGGVGTAIDFALTLHDWQSGEPLGEATARFGGRTLGTALGGFGAGAAWGSFVGPHGTLAVGFLGAIVGGFGGEKAVDLMMGK